MHVQAASITIGCKHVTSMPGSMFLVRVPASHTRLEASMPKFDTRPEAPTEDAAAAGSQAPDGHSSSRGDGYSNSGSRDPHPLFITSDDSDLLRGTLYPDAPITEYLPRCKVWRIYIISLSPWVPLVSFFPPLADACTLTCTLTRPLALFPAAIARPHRDQRGARRDTGRDELL